jgi:hypothetical protein
LEEEVGGGEIPVALALELGRPCEQEEDGTRCGPGVVLENHLPHPTTIIRIPIKSNRILRTITNPDNNHPNPDNNYPYLIIIIDTDNYNCGRRDIRYIMIASLGDEDDDDPSG